MATKVPSETSEAKMLTRHLTLCKVLHCAVPNDGLRDKRSAAEMKAKGVKKGVPDYLVFDPPPSDTSKVGVALELKKIDGVPSDVSTWQRRWLSDLSARGWVPMVAYGYRDAIDKLKALGYRL